MDLFELSATLGLDTSAFGIGVSTAKNMLNGLADFAQETFAWLGNVALDFGKDVLDTGLGFDKAMGSVRAVLGREEGTAENMATLRKFAMEQARDSIFTTEEAADAYYYMGMAGWKTEQMLGGLPGIMALAAASGEDLALVSDIVTDSMTAFGWGADRASEYADILAATVTNSNTDVAQLGTAFKYAAPLAGNFGLDVKDIAVSLGLMASQGIKGSQAGTTLRSMMQRLAADTNEARSTLENLGVAVFDDDGKMRDWSDIIDDTRKAFAGLSDEQKSNIAYTVAGKTGMSGFLALINATEEDVNSLTEALEKSEGAAQWMSETRLDNLSGDIEYLNSELNVLKTSLYDNVKDPLREVVQEGTEGLHRITDAIQEDGIIGGLKQLTEELRNLKENETFKEFLKSAGEAGGEILSIITTDVLPGLGDTVVSLGHSLGVGLFSGIYDSVSEKYPFLGNGSLIGWISGRNKSGPEIKLDPKFGVNDIEAAISEALKNGTDVVEIGGEKFSIAQAEALRDQILYGLGDVDKDIGNIIQAGIEDGGDKASANVASTLVTDIGNADIENPIINALMSAGNDGGNLLYNALFGIISGNLPGLSQEVGNAIGDAGPDAGRDIVSGIKTALSFAKFTVSVAGIISSIVNTKKNASAMSSGRIFNKPTIFGYADNAFQIAGDAGPEAVVGTNSLYSMITSAVNSAAAGQEVVVPRDSGRDITIILEVDRQQFARTVYKANNEETQRVGVRLGGAY